MTDRYIIATVAEGAAEPEYHLAEVNSLRDALLGIRDAMDELGEPMPRVHRVMKLAGKLDDRDHYELVPVGHWKPLADVLAASLYGNA